MIHVPFHGTWNGIEGLAEPRNDALLLLDYQHCPGDALDIAVAQPGEVLHHQPVDEDVAAADLAPVGLTDARGQSRIYQLPTHSVALKAQPSGTVKSIAAGARASSKSCCSIRWMSGAS